MSNFETQGGIGRILTTKTRRARRRRAARGNPPEADRLGGPWIV